MKEEYDEQCQLVPSQLDFHDAEPDADEVEEFRCFGLDLEEVEQQVAIHDPQAVRKDDITWKGLWPISSCSLNKMTIKLTRQIDSSVDAA